MQCLVGISASVCPEDTFGFPTCPSPGTAVWSPPGLGLDSAPLSRTIFNSSWNPTDAPSTVTSEPNKFSLLLLAPASQLPSLLGCRNTNGTRVYAVPRPGLVVLDQVAPLPSHTAADEASPSGPRSHLTLLQAEPVRARPRCSLSSRAGSGAPEPGLTWGRRWGRGALRPGGSQRLQARGRHLEGRWCQSCGAWLARGLHGMGAGLWQWVSGSPTVEPSPGPKGTRTIKSPPATMKSAVEGVDSFVSGSAQGYPFRSHQGCVYHLASACQLAQPVFAAWGSPHTASPRLAEPCLWPRCPRLKSVLLGLFCPTPLRDIWQSRRAFLCCAGSGQRPGMLPNTL